MARVAIITGAASGIGRALTRAIVARGAEVVAADIDVDGVRQTVEEANTLGPGSATAAGVDVRDAAGVADLVRRTHERHGRVDFMFNNAGVGVGGLVEELEVEYWDRAIDVNLRGVVHGVQAVYPLMIEQGGGHIVNTASLAGLIPSPFTTPYAGAKHGVVGLSTSLRAEAAAHDVHVQVVCPGVVDTPMLDSRGPKDLPTPPSAERTFRAYLTRLGVRPYPADRFAEEVLRGVARNDPIIIAPWSAKLAWGTYRVSPALVERVTSLIVRGERALRE